MKIHLELTEGSAGRIGYLSLGYMTIQQGDKTITNKYRTPNQACMLFPSLAFFMGQLEELEMRDRTEGEFIGSVLSSLQNYFCLCAERMIALRIGP